MNDKITITFDKNKIFMYIFVVLLGCNPLALLIGFIVGEFSLPIYFQLINVIGSVMFGWYLFQVINPEV